MITRILVPLDGSALAESALPVAAQVTRAIEGTLILFRAYDITQSDYIEAIMDAEAEEAQTYLAGIAHRPELAGLQIETREIGGAAAHNILDAVQAYQADLLVMSSHGRSGFTRWALGSVAEYVIRHAPVPVLVLHEPHESKPLHTASPTALVALDGSLRAESALGPAADVLAALAAPQDGTLHLVRVVAPPVEIHSESASMHPTPLIKREDAILREAEDYLLRLSERIQTHGIDGHHPTASWSLHVAEEVTPALVHAGQEGRETLFLALATHGRGSLERWKSGSIAAAFLEQSTLPLLIVLAPETKGGA